ncbi:MAG: hypothetical protein KC415_05440 [Anaerolineales bacterium]|nr:hypothetical protein [Anaerolineales bacterium]
MTNEQLQLAIQIDTYVTQLYANGGTDEDLLTTIPPYLPLFKRLLDTTKPGEMDALCQRYEGFYTFAKMLENLAGAIRDGVIEVPTDAPLPPRRTDKPERVKKKRPRKPKPKRQQQRQIRRPLSFLPALTEVIIGSLAQTKEQHESFAAARHKPHVLDDALVDRAIRLYEEQLTSIPLHERQLTWWLADEITDAQRYQVQDLQTKLPQLRAKTEALLALLAELKQGTIDRIMEMSDEELALKVLRGELNPPWQT